MDQRVIITGVTDAGLEISGGLPSRLVPWSEITDIHASFVKDGAHQVLIARTI